MIADGEEAEAMDVEGLLQAEGRHDDAWIMEILKHRFEKTSSATDLRFKIPPLSGEPKQLGFGTLVVPGWICERAAEVLYDEDELGEREGLPNAILRCLVKVGKRWFRWSRS